MDIEREPFLRVVDMNADAAKKFAMPEAVKVVCVGQADQKKYRFGARVYLLFRTVADYNEYLRNWQPREETP